MNTPKPIGSLSLDVDNLWSYMKTHGDAGWEKYPSYLDIFVPAVLDVLDDLNLQITFFVVGQDTALEKNKEALKLLTERGHEVGNHSFHHEPWLHRYTKDQIRREIVESEEQILRITGQRPVGFRGPGFSWSTELFEVLAENNYLYDASTLPTFIGPLARAYYFWTAKLTEEEKNDRRELFGSLQDGFRPVKPYRWQLNSGATLLEIPVTTVPLFKIPFHLSYLLYLSRFSLGLMKMYLQAALAICRITGTGPSFLLHPLDLLGGDKIPELAFFPGMDLSTARKDELFRTVVNTIVQHFSLVKMSSYAQAILKCMDTKILRPKQTI